MERFKCPIGVFVLLKKDNSIYLQLRKNCSFSGMYGLIGGHSDGNEKIVTAAIREAKEETNITIEPQHLKLATICHSNAGGMEYLQFFFICEVWNGKIENMEPEKCTQIELFDLDNLPENLVPYLPVVLKNIKQQIVFFEDEF